MENPFKKIILGAAIASSLASCQEEQSRPAMDDQSKPKIELAFRDRINEDTPLAEILSTAPYEEVTLGPDQVPPVEEIVRTQRQWTIESIKSAGYKKRMMRELAVQMGVSADDPRVDQAADQMIAQRLKRVETVPIHFSTETRNGAYYPRSNQTREMMDGKPVVLTNAQHGVIELGIGFEYQYPHQLIHELSHASTDNRAYGDGQVDSTERNLVEHSQPGIEGVFRSSIDAGVEYGYDNAPTEEKSHIDALRYVLDQYGIYDSNTGDDFTIENVKQIMDHPEILSDIDIRTLFKTTPKVKDLIWKMNHVG